MTDSIEKINKIRGVTYFWKQNEFGDNKEIKPKEIGFIAQELKHALPEVVYSKNDEYFKVKYPDIIALCLESIKEQSILLDIKESKLEILEKRAKEKGLI
jgi:hypothetical protein